MSIRINLLSRSKTITRPPVFYTESPGKPSVNAFLSTTRPLPYSYGPPVKQTVVFYREQLMISDIPKMQTEFARQQRDDLLILHFLDIFHPIAKYFHKHCLLPDKEKGIFLKALSDLGINHNNPYSVKYFLSKILRFSGIRFPEAPYDPLETLAPIIALNMFGLTNLVLNERELRIWCSDKNRIECIEKQSGLPPEDLRKLSIGMRRINGLVYDLKPTFHRSVPSLQPLCVFTLRSQLDLPKTFLTSPAQFIESQENVQKGEGFPKHGFLDLNQRPYDVSRLKRFLLKDKKGNVVSVISKRLEALRVNSVEEEISEAEKINLKLKKAGIENCRTVEYLGIIYDRENFYLLMRDEQSPSLFDCPKEEGTGMFEKVKKVLSNGEHDDLEPRNALWNGEELVLLDFERHSTVVSVKNLPPYDLRIIFAVLSSVNSGAKLRGALKHFGLKSLPLLQRYAAVLDLRKITKKRIPKNIAIGDIHGNADRLEQILETTKSADRVVFLGDYFDRDSDGKRVFELLKSRPAEKSVFLLGNHELYFLMSMKGDRHSFTEWLKYGGLSFLQPIFNLRQFAKAQEQALTRVENNIIDIIEHIEQNNPIVITHLLEDLQKNSFFKEMFAWLAEHGKLFYVDELCNLYIHAGVNLKKGGGIDYLEHLEAIEKQFFSKLKNGNLSECQQLAKEFGPHLTIREDEWVAHFDQRDWDKIRIALVKMGIRTVVYGHTSRSTVLNLSNRLFGIDLSMAKHYGGLGGYLEVGPEGVNVYRFASADQDELKKDKIMDGEILVEELHLDAGRLIRTFQDYLIKP